ncbi:uncharacterized protein A4U43_C02F16490 [Asparagus officinalis]|uniref:Uncharacterized protein n=1 Tax=Asparagus officinalis TaxID=4686 RepID=A0A5P1FMR3_ASPOF|nr:uncharacterized protein A4U43_C02F16490 [Asparagus officinalis]
MGLKFYPCYEGKSTEERPFIPRCRMDARGSIVEFRGNKSKDVEKILLLDNEVNLKEAREMAKLKATTKGNKFDELKSSQAVVEHELTQKYQDLKVTMTGAWHHKAQLA